VILLQAAAIICGSRVFGRFAKVVTKYDNKKNDNKNLV
jgi:hypothetical protein